MGAGSRMMAALRAGSDPVWAPVSGSGTRALGKVRLEAMDMCEIAVRLQPRARANEIVGEREGVLVVRVTAPPIDGRANDALCRLIAKRARVGVRSVSVVRGAGAREKVVRVQGMTSDELRRALAAGPKDMP
jgi:uncharacterized protein